MYKKNKKLLLALSLASSLVISSSIGILLSSCTTTNNDDDTSDDDNNSGSDDNDSLYDYVIDWNNQNQVNSLITDNQGLVFSNNAKTTLIAIKPSSNLTTITIPSTVTSIGGYKQLVTNARNGEQTYKVYGAFQNYTSILSVSLDSNSKLQTIGDYAFSGCTNLTTFDTSNLINIGQSAFSGCTKLESIDLSNIKEIGQSAFNNTGIKEIDLTECENLTKISESSFANCTNLTTVYLPTNDISTLEAIEDSAFSGCTNLVTVAPKGSTGFVATSKISTIGAMAFKNTKIATINVSNMTLNSNDKFTGSATSFALMPLLTNVEIPSGIVSLKAGMFYGSGLKSDTGFTLTLPSTISSLKIDEVIDIETNEVLSENASPFSNSGLASIDLSRIISYQSDENKTLALPDYLFNDCSKLTSVMLNSYTSAIGNSTFANCSSLEKITYTNIYDTRNGYIAQSALKTIGENAFSGAFSENSDAIVDFTQLSNLETIPTGLFANSNVKTINLPTTTKVIKTKAFENTTKLSSVNFSSLSNLTTIEDNNFTNTILTEIDLTNTSFTNFNNSMQLFSNIGANCTVYLPNTFSSLSIGGSDVFTTLTGSKITYAFLNGMNSTYVPTTYVTNGIFSNAEDWFNNSSIINNTNTFDFSNNSIFGLGTKSFFENSNLVSLALSAKGISASGVNIFNGSNLASNTNNTTSPNEYTTSNLPLGNNKNFKSLNFKNFTNVTSTDSTSLFNKTNLTTWQEVIKIMNSLSYQTPANSSDTATTSNVAKNLSTWTKDTTQTVTSKISDDITIQQKDIVGSSSKYISFENVFPSPSHSEFSVVNIIPTTKVTMLIHNGITWTYTNDGSSITLTGQANMYKATNDSNSYLCFFNQNTYQDETNDTTYYVPGDPITVTLTVATK